VPEHPTQACIDRAVELHGLLRSPDGRGAERVRELLEGNQWTFAKTMADNPHWYTIRDTWQAWEEFYACCLFIRTEGKVEWWPCPVTGFPFVYLDLNGFHYWTLGYPLKGHRSGPTYVINRKPLNP
jgi:hypothetical protein